MYSGFHLRVLKKFCWRQKSLAVVRRRLLIKMHLPLERLPLIKLLRFGLTYQRSLCALSSALFGRSRYLCSLFPVAMLGHCAGDSEPLKKQVAMIAQKIVDAKHTQQDRRRPVTAPNPRAFAFG